MTEPKFHFPDPDSGDTGNQVCQWCGGKKLIRGAQLLDYNQDQGRPITVAKDGKPHAILFKDRSSSPTRVIVCGTCGYVHLFATSPSSLGSV